MEFRDLKKQYQVLKRDIDISVQEVMKNANYISGKQVTELEKELAEYVGVKHCISCGNGTDALQLALMAWGIGEGDAVFVPDFTFFSSAEVIAAVGAVPVFVDVDEETFNISPVSLEDAIHRVAEEGKWRSKAIIAVDLFGLPANYPEIQRLADQYHLKILEDGAQGFGGSIHGKRACSFGNVGTTSFFPAKPLGCYGDGGAIFTDDDETANILLSLRVHGKGNDKYDNIRIGMNSRLDTIQAAILQVKLRAFAGHELSGVNEAAKNYHNLLAEANCKIPEVPTGYLSSWAQYTILLPDEKTRDMLQAKLKGQEIPSMIYYKKAMHEQAVFQRMKQYTELRVSTNLCKRVLSLPMHPYLEEEEQKRVCDVMKNVLS